MTKTPEERLKILAEFQEGHEKAMAYFRSEKYQEDKRKFEASIKKKWLNYMKSPSKEK